MGFAAVRDVVSFLRHDETQANPLLDGLHPSVSRRPSASASRNPAASCATTSISASTKTSLAASCSTA